MAILVSVVTAASLLLSGVYADETDSVHRIRVAVTKGGNVLLDCRKSGSEKSTRTVAEWKYQKTDGRSAFRVSLNRYVTPRFQRRFVVRASNDSDGDVLDFSLIISSVMRSDAGIYTCLISDELAEFRRFVHLDVTEAATVRTATVGSDVTLPCNSTFLNPVKWTYRDNTWGTISTVLKRGCAVTSHDNITRFSVKNGSDLAISDVVFNDSGLYVCAEDGGFGAKHPVILLVLNDGEANSSANESLPWLTRYPQFNNSVLFKLDEESLTDDIYPIMCRIHTGPVTLPLVVASVRSFDWTLLAVAVMSVFIVIGFIAILKVIRTDEKLRRKNSGLLNGKDDEIDPESSVVERTSRQRLYGISVDDDADVMEFSNIQRHGAPSSSACDVGVTLSESQPFTGLEIVDARAQSLPVLVSDSGVVSPEASSSSNPVVGFKPPGPVTDPLHLQFVPSEQGVIPEEQVVVVHATVERQPSDNSSSHFGQ